MNNKNQIILPENLLEKNNELVNEMASAFGDLAEEIKKFALTLKEFEENIKGLSKVFKGRGRIMTNFKRIKQMSVEEFAKLNNIELSFFGIANFIQEADDECEFCAYNENCKGADCMTCLDGIIEWLNQEVEQ